MKMKKIGCLITLVFLLVVNGYAADDDIKGGWNDVTKERQVKGCVSGLVSQLKTKIKSEYEGKVLPGDIRDMDDTLDEATEIAAVYCKCIVDQISTKWSLKTYARLQSEEKEEFIKDRYCSGTCTLDANVELIKCD